MSRGFISGGGDGSKKNGGRDKNKLGKMLSAVRDQSRGDMIKERSAHQTKDYSEMLEDLIDEKLFSSNPNKYKFTMPGTQEQEAREMTKGMKAALEMAQQARMKKRNKQRGAKVDIVPKSFGSGPDGGRITKEGKILNNQGVVLFTINPKTGIITDGFGLKVGKYAPNSIVFETRIEKLIQKHSANKAKFNPFAPKT